MHNNYISVGVFLIGLCAFGCNVKQIRNAQIQRQNGLSEVTKLNIGAQFRMAGQDALIESDATFSISELLSMFGVAEPEIADWTNTFGMDAWGNEIRVRIESDRIRLWSLGPNRKDDESNGDDMVFYVPRENF